MRRKIFFDVPAFHFSFDRSLTGKSPAGYRFPLGDFVNYFPTEPFHFRWTEGGNAPL